MTNRMTFFNRLLSLAAGPLKSTSSKPLQNIASMSNAATSDGESLSMSYLSRPKLGMPVNAVLASTASLLSSFSSPPIHDSFILTNTPGKPAQTAYFASGCFWGTEHIFLKHFPVSSSGILSTRVGYIGGKDKSDGTPPTYREVCSGQTGHAEAIKIVFDESLLPYADLVGEWILLKEGIRGL
jgi:hypothetical protein